MMEAYFEELERIENTRLVPLTKGKFAKVDAIDYQTLRQYRWSAMYVAGRYYAVRKKKGQSILMHRQIVNPVNHVDHINGDSLDNRRRNLRECTNRQNSHNRGAAKANPTGLKGVAKYGDRWRSAIRYSDQSFFLGLYDTKEIAAKIYDREARKLHGAFACLNFPKFTDYDDLPPPCLKRNNTSGYRGIKFDKRRNKWVAKHGRNRKSKHLGEFIDKEEAARAYDKHVKMVLGDRARLNFPTE